ncbi:pyridoxal phosphate-dependent transferase, partial [Chytridium lagenaria]
LSCRNVSRSCPFLARTPASTLRQLSTTINGCPHASATASAAQQCPVMGKALAVQSVRRMATMTNLPEKFAKHDGIVPPPPSAGFARPRPRAPLLACEIDKKHSDKSYRYFNNINRLAQEFPKAHVASGEHVTVWCSNDYLGMSKHPLVVQDMKQCSHLSSCFVANDATLSTLASKMPGCVIFSDASNHASMIQGMQIFHNDVNHLETLLQKYDRSVPKIIAFESVYSMCGSIAITFLDEVHAVGMYGNTGAGVAEYIDAMDEMDIITGTLERPMVLLVAILVNPHSLSENRLADLGIPVVPNPSHIVPVLVGDAVTAKAVSDELLHEHAIYVQSINFPTVSKGEERLRITPTPGHHDAHMEKLVTALESIWTKRGLKRENDWEKLGGCAGLESGRRWSSLCRWRMCPLLLLPWSLATA